MTTSLNPAGQPDYSRLLDLDALAAWTLDRQREHTADLAAYEATLAAFQTALRSENVPGDGLLSAKFRARRVEKHIKALAKASRKAAAEAEALRTSYAGHIARVAALPAQREAKALKKAGRRQALGELTSKSLHKTAASLAAPAETPEAEAAPAPAAGTVRGINDLWRKGA
ncbi:hypothetical protein [Streptomyces fradiae]|uniref:hypothetical protein n=1 Tax=Streptomyces fradiae TaxID=1906 RepID=UPI003695E7AD